MPPSFFKPFDRETGSGTSLDSDADAGSDINGLTDPSPQSLSPITAYYLHNFLQAQGYRVGTRESDFSLHLKQVSDPATIAGNVRRLEQLTLTHQALISRGAKYHHRLRTTEAEMLQLLGFSSSFSFKRATVLVIDDTLPTLQWLTYSLTQHHYEVSSAIHPTIALARIHEIRPDIVLMEINMPEVDGFTVCQRLKADPKTQQVPVIFISAHEGRMEKVKAFQAGGSDFVAKPIQLEELLTRLEAQLQRSRRIQQLHETQAQLQADLKMGQQQQFRYARLSEFYRRSAQSLSLQARSPRLPSRLSPQMVLWLWAQGRSQI